MTQSWRAGVQFAAQQDHCELALDASRGPLRTVEICWSSGTIPTHLELWVCGRDQPVFWTNLWLDEHLFAIASIGIGYSRIRLIRPSSRLDQNLKLEVALYEAPWDIVATHQLSGLDSGKPQSTLGHSGKPHSPLGHGSTLQELLQEVASLKQRVSDLDAIKSATSEGSSEHPNSITEEYFHTMCEDLDQRLFEHVQAALPALLSNAFGSGMGRSSVRLQLERQPEQSAMQPPSGVNVRDLPNIQQLEKKLADKLRERAAMVQQLGGQAK